MGLLGDFAGNFLTLAGNEGMRREDENRQLRLQEALERRRRKYAEQDALRTRRWGNEDRADQLAAAGPAPGFDEQGNYGLLRQRGEVDPETGRLRVSSERIADAPWRPGKRATMKTKDGTVTGVEWTNGLETEFRPDGEPLPPRQSRSGGGATQRPRYDVANVNGRRVRTNLDTMEQTDLGPAGKAVDSAGKKPEKSAAEKLTSNQRVTYLKEIDQARTEQELRLIAEGLGVDTSRIDQSFEGEETAPQRIDGLKAALRAAIKPGGAPAPKAESKAAESVDVPAALANEPDGTTARSNGVLWKKQGNKMVRVQ